MRRVTTYLPAGTSEETVVGSVTLGHDERHLRRKLLHLEERHGHARPHSRCFCPWRLLLMDDGNAIEVRH
jgi:urease accessory protein